MNKSTLPVISCGHGLFLCFVMFFFCINNGDAIINEVGGSADLTSAQSLILGDLLFA